MPKIEEGRCGQCKFYDAHDIIDKSSSTTWGVCNNLAIPVLYTVSTNSPRQALEAAKAYRELGNLIREDKTCLKN